jgi:hypothetical protein
MSTLESLQRFYRRPRELKALEHLRCPEEFPGLVPWPSQCITVRCIELPSFTPRVVWALRHELKVSAVRRIEWDHCADVQLADILPKSAPTIYGADAPLPPAEVKQLLAELTSISVPAWVQRSAWGTDGVSFGIEFGDGWLSAHYSWWCEPPPPWQPLADWFARAKALFEQHLPPSTARLPQKHSGPPR